MMNPHIENVFKQIKKNFPPLKGLIHAAGLVDDELFMHTTWQRFQSIFRLKVAGSWFLHEFTKTLALDHFILFSSDLIDVEPFGKSNAAMGNSFLDALSHYRLKNGLPALTIDWGPWERRHAEMNHLINTS